MKLHSLKKIVSSPSKRVGRGFGSGKGTKSGRGTTRHQSAREKIPTHFEGGQNRLVKKFPLIRGKGKNKSVANKPFLIDFEDLLNWDEGKPINILNLFEGGIISKSDLKRGVKLSSKGEAKAFSVEIPATKSAVAKLEKKGGKMLTTL